MATTLNEIHEILDNKGINNEIDDNERYVATGSATEAYTDSDGANGISIAIEADESGEFVKIIAPNLYVNKQPYHELAVLQTCMQITRRMKMIQCLYDESDGEVRMEIDIPLEDSSLSSNQLMRALACIVEVVDTFDECFRAAIDEGKATVLAVFEKRKKQAELARLIKESSGDDIDLLIQQLEFTTDRPSANGEQQLVLH